MSECVVQMKMPKCCDDCDANYDCCACGIIGAFWFRNPRYKEFDSSKERLPDCPIICQLPEGHGRLVDVNDIPLAMVERGQRSSRYKFGEMWELNLLEIQEALQTVSTIVPAERGEI